MKPIADEVPMERLRAVAEGENLLALIISITLSFVFWLTAPELLITRDTVALDTPASLAISIIVKLFIRRPPGHLQIVTGFYISYYRTV